MNLSQTFESIKSLPLVRIIAALALAGVVFLLTSSFLGSGAFVTLFSSEKETAVEEAVSLKEGGPSKMIMPTPRQPRQPQLLDFTLFKPLLYLVLFLLIYLLFFQKREPGKGGGNWFLYFASVLVLLVFVFSSADLLRLVLNYYLEKTPYPKDSYLFQGFAEQLARRMAALLLSLPVFAFLNFKISRKGSEVKGFFLTLFSLIGVFTLLLAWWLLNGLLVWGLGVKGIELKDYTFPLAYFSILFPLALFYLVQYLRR